MVPVQEKIEVIPLHETFGAEIRGVDFSKPIPPNIIDEVRRALGTYGVLTFKDSSITDKQYTDFLSNYGTIDVQRGKAGRVSNRLLGDASNIHLDGSIVQKGDLQWYVNRATGIFHCDSTYDPRRIRFTSVMAKTVLPPEVGGATEFADSRTAYDDLDDETKDFIKDKVGCHSNFHSRKIACPDFPTFQALKPENYPFGKQYLVQTNPISGRKDLYVASHLHHIEGMDPEESWALIQKLRAHVEQEKYVLKIPYRGLNHFTFYDNLAVLHRAGQGTYAGKYARDVRRCTLYDDSEEEWGLNSRSDPRLNVMDIIKAVHEEVMGKKEKLIDYD